MTVVIYQLSLVNILRIMYFLIIATIVNTTDRVIDVCSIVNLNTEHMYKRNILTGKFKTNATQVSIIDSFHAL
jgi:hypothetical protein